MLKGPTERPPVMSGFLGIATRISDPVRRQLHVGIAYCVTTGQVRLSHLAWHCALRDEPLRDDYLWADIASVDDVNRPGVVAYLHSMRMSLPQVPYGFRHLGFRFNVDEQTGSITFDRGVPSGGLTCATYVTKVFETLSLPMIDMATWPKSRPDDDAWREHIVALMIEHGVDAAHVETVRADGADVRIRPQEVVAAGGSCHWPVAFTAADTVAADIVAEIERLIAGVQ